MVTDGRLLNSAAAHFSLPSVGNATDNKNKQIDDESMLE
jgi:hypothetical protein